MYLTAGKRLFVNPQFPLLLNGSEVVPDFVALDPAAKQVWLVEVSWAQEVSKLLKKCRNYVIHEALIQEQLGVACPPDWKIGLWLFLKGETAAVVSAKMTVLGNMELRIETLERAGAVWEWSKVKLHSGEPKVFVTEPV
ncbi:hypothetical protein DS843_22450 [Roseomonas genomospecies 6]|uniref:Uncharacterized protein n=1 Tax=Roseomonas genomospecies 6 TaxID=214106 RepID=A0A9W7KQS5_9PROT|nr:hypothetical protein DS843_22450 [Roseomonas genomospecies 6]